MKTKIFFFALMIILHGLTTISQAQDEPMADRIKDMIQHEAFRINALIQAGFRYSFQNDGFQGGRTFEAANARLSFRGTVDGRFYYRVMFNMVSEPNLLDAFAGYHHSDGFRLTAGAMKPRQTLDFIPNPGATDFIDRAIITGLLVQSREIGISAMGDIDNFYYYAGFFNGNRLSDNNNNKFYGIGRLQYAFRDLIPGTIQIAVSGSHGNSQGVRTGSKGPLLRGERTIYGTDIRIETNKILLAAEYLAGNLETADLAGRKETISGYYFTGGYRFLEKTMALARWQSWGYRELGFRDNQLTLGINHDFTGITSFQFNLDSYLPENGDNKYGISMILQLQF